MLSYYHVLCCGFSELDVTDWILERRKLGTWSTWSSILTDLGMAKLKLLAVRVPVDVNVCDAHCECGSGDRWICGCVDITTSRPICDRSWWWVGYRCSSRRMLLMFVCIAWSDWNLMQVFQ
jgi:hypothetical protein